MIDFIPVNLYTPIYYYVVFLMVLITVINTRIQVLNSSSTYSLNKNFGFFVFIFVLFYMGLRPIHWTFLDMTTYNSMFQRYKWGADITSTTDLFFHSFVKFLSQLVTAQMFFFICACLYVFPLYIVCKKWFQEYWFYAFLLLVTSFSFWAYGTNGIRNGIAGSLFLLGISREKRLWQVLWFALAINFHKTMLLPLMGYVISNFYNQPKKLILLWILCIPISLLAGGAFEIFFGAIGFDDDRMSYFTADISAESFSSTGFRWDFIAYSATAVFAGWYYIVKKGFKDHIYFFLFNTYIFSNAFWILVIRANFSNRFAYLSWFMISLVLIYPLLKQPLLPNQHKTIGLILFGFFCFTFLMNVVLANH